MATGNILSAVINVSAPGVKEAFKAVAVSVDGTTKSLTVLQKQVAAFGGGVRPFVTTVTAIPAALNKVPPAVESTNQALRKLPQTSNTATQSLINLGRVVQDAPFGFLGIANNLNPLLESFQRLRATTNTSGEAFKALGKSLLGAGGLGFAISAVSSLLIVFGDKLFGSAEASKASEKAFADLADQMDNVKGAVKDLSSELDFLNTIGAIDLKILGFGDLSELRAQSGAQQAFTRDLRKQMEELQKIRSRINDNEDLSEEDREKSLKDHQKEVEALNDQIIESERRQQVIYKKIALQKVEDQKDADEKRLKAYKDYLRRLKEQMEFEEGLFKGLAEGLKAVQEIFQREILKDQAVRLNIGADIKLDTLSTNFAEPVKEISTDIQKAVERLTKTNPILIRANAKVELTPDDKALQQTLDNINQILERAIEDSFTAFGENLGEALAGGNILDAFKGFASVVGGAVKAIGQQLIQLGVTAKAAQLALKGLFKNPVAQIAVGVALVAIGSAMQKLLSGGVKGFAGGGYTGPGGKYDVAGVVHKDEFVFPKQAVHRLGVGYLNNLAFGSNVRGYAEGGFVSGGLIGGVGGGSHKVVFEIAGQKLIGVLSLAQAQLRRLA